MLFFGTLHLDAYIFPFLLCFSLLFFSQLFVRPPQTAILPFAFLFHGDGLDPCLLYNVMNVRSSGTLSIRSRFEYDYSRDVYINFICDEMQLLLTWLYKGTKRLGHIYTMSCNCVHFFVFLCFPQIVKYRPSDLGITMKSNTGTYIYVFIISGYGGSQKLSFEKVYISKWYL